jgi:F-type H+-transporting ATPase subunit b
MATSTTTYTTAGGHVPTATSTAVAGDGHHGQSKFPPFDSSTFAPQLVWLALTFGFLYFVMSRIALPRVGSVLAERRERIQRDLAEAERLKAETDAALKSYEKSLADARIKAQTMAKSMRDTADAELDREKRRVDEANAVKLSETEARIAATKSQAMASVDQIASETAAAIVERLIGQSAGAPSVRSAPTSENAV